MRTRGCLRLGGARLSTAAAAALMLVAADARGADCSVGCLMLPAAPAPAPINSLSVAVGDVNGDGRDDLVALTDNTSTNGDAVWVHLQRADGTLGPASWSYGAGMPGVISAAAVAIGDVTGDGRNDLVLATVYGLDVFPQLAGGGFGAPVAVTDPAPIAMVRIGDFNHDGRLDVAALARLQPPSAQTFDEVHLFLQTSAGRLAAPTIIALGYPGATDLEVADLNGDGRLDLVVGDGPAPSGSFVILTATAAGGFSAPSPVSLGTASSGRSEYAPAVAAGDIDGDGRIDLAASTNFDPAIVLLKQSAGGTFTQSTLGRLSAPIGALALRDLSRDGHAETVTIESGALGIWLAGQGTEQRFTTGPQAGAPESIAFGDLNGDGKLDVAVAGGASFTVGGSAVFYGTAADLQVTGSDAMDPVLGGGFSTYTMVVTNAGPDVTTGVTMDLPRAGAYTPTQGTCDTQSARCTIGTLAVGASASVTFKLFAATVGTLHAVATASGYAFDPNPGNNSHDESTTVVPAADLTVSQELFPTALTPGDFIDVTNLGPADAESVMLTLTASTGLVVTGATVPASATCRLDVVGQITCALGTLPAGTPEKRTVIVGLSAAAPGTYTLTASVSSTTADPNIANNTDTQSMTLVINGIGTVGGAPGGGGATGGTGVTGVGGLTGHGPAAGGGGGCGCAAGPAAADGGWAGVAFGCAALAMLASLAARRPARRRKRVAGR